MPSYFVKAEASLMCMLKTWVLVCSPRTLCLHRSAGRASRHSYRIVGRDKATPQGVSANDNDGAQRHEVMELEGSSRQASNNEIVSEASNTDHCVSIMSYTMAITKPRSGYENNIVKEAYSAVTLEQYL